MPRAKGGPKTRARRKRVLNLAEGYWGAKSKLFRIATEQVDRSLKEFGFPVGPIALLDEVGIDVGAHVARDLGEAFAARGLQSSPVLPRLHAAGYLGRKNRRGFYLYPPGARKGRKRVNADVYRFFGESRRASLRGDEIAQRLGLMMVNEAARCLVEGVIACPRDGDVGAVFGLGFPPFRGGPFRYVDQEGAGAVAAQLERLAERHGARFLPAAAINERTGTGRGFYG